MNRRETKVGLLACFAFLLAFPGAISGGLLIAPLLAFCALLMTPLQPISYRRIEWAWPLIPGMLFLLWTATSFLWSPHDNPEQIPKTVLGIPLYILFAWRVGALEGPWRERALGCLIVFVFAAATMFVFESLTGGHGTISFKIGFENADITDMRGLLHRVSRSLGHGVAVLVLLAGPAAILLWLRGAPRLAFALLALTFIAAMSFGLAVNAIAFVASALVVAFAYFKPRLALPTIFIALAGFVVIMPVFMPSLIAIIPESMLGQLPQSWVWRLEIWEFASDLIVENPWFGYGLDASRELGEGIQVEGYNWDVLPLHPHNAALHIWLETGLVGVILLAASLLAVGDVLGRQTTMSQIEVLALAWVLTSYACLLVFSYGVWQEWHQASLALAIAAVRMLRPEAEAANMLDTDKSDLEKVV
ncbi:MAG: O-antigen ligase family protein [Alphaproteobacteria bacterium]|nr:O-antigen ligase family protein [Alphaproteobacteria bacterium]